MILSYDATSLSVSNWFGHTVQRFDLSDPFNPTLLSAATVPHPNMLRLSRDDSRLSVTNSLLTPWDDDADFGSTRASHSSPESTDVPRRSAGPERWR
jgi:hypothetical protein